MVQEFINTRQRHTDFATNVHVQTQHEKKIQSATL